MNKIEIEKIIVKDDQIQLLNYPCGKKLTTFNGTIELYLEIIQTFDCLILIEVDDGQNIFLRFDDLNWDRNENFIKIGLFHDHNQYEIFHITGLVKIENTLFHKRKVSL